MVTVSHFSQMIRAPIPPSPPRTMPKWAIDQRGLREAQPADKNGCADAIQDPVQSQSDQGFCECER